MVIMVLRVIRVTQDQQALKVIKVTQDQLAHKVIKEILAQ
jgi:hypothetical protein